MPKKQVETPKPKAMYTLVLDSLQADRLQQWCLDRAWESFSVPYAQFAFRGNDVNLVFYQKSGKLVVQGKNTEDFVYNVLEPEITKEFKLGLERLEHPEWFRPHAGMDESGKGDLFGPLVAACVIADESHVDFWLKNGLKESKQVSSDARVFKLEQLVRNAKGVVVEVAYAGMEKYNQLYSKFNNLNNLLAWFHAKALEGALKKRSVSEGLLDQFATTNLVQRYLKVENFNLQQQVRAESDPVVAAASIIARAEYLRQLKRLSEQATMPLPKGCGSQAKEVLQKLIELQGRDSMSKFIKLHFKTFQGV